ncbi:hypothetical protein BRADI_3g32441v3 [Brachypodium distachyon]|uniref:F-box protein AT5G49610-like beta-propeller domain-containing protein n=2 Tax=Brachypodium distachyon TaxID=15368 RepID=A0A2K2D0L1_BRADI|nr:hypothetical protein BRADI_3g32441v3 [Brachypodium distachyon]
MLECRDGYALLINGHTEEVAVYDPLTGALHLFPVPSYEVYDEGQVDFHVFSFEEDHESFRVVCVSSDVESAAVLSRDDREWEIFPLDEDEGGHYWPHEGTPVNGSVYRAFADGYHVCVLNITTPQFFRIYLPPDIAGTDNFKVGETKDGNLCLVSASKLRLVVWVWRAGDDGINRWMLENTYRLRSAHKIPQHSSEDYLVGKFATYLKLKVVGIIGGIVYLSGYSCADSGYWFLSFCLEKEELNKLCRITKSIFSYPYIMAWPNSLVHNKVNLQLEGA